MSYNNYLDGDAAYTAVCDFPEPSCVIVKHTNPCGAASRGDLKEAYPLAVRADPTSAFGGIVAFNRYGSATAVPASPCDTTMQLQSCLLQLPLCCMLTDWPSKLCEGDAPHLGSQEIYVTH